MLSVKTKAGMSVGRGRGVVGGWCKIVKCSDGQALQGQRFELHYCLRQLPTCHLKYPTTPIKADIIIHKKSPNTVDYTFLEANTYQNISPSLTKSKSRVAPQDNFP